MGETYEALLAGIQGALWELRGVPNTIRQDNLSAATHELAEPGGRALTKRFGLVVDHDGFESSRIEPGEAHQNGVVENANDLLKVALGDNVLLFGRPGVGNSHVACALDHALVGAGVSVLFIPTYQLVQQLLAARHDLSLPRALRALDAYDVMILEDLGYVQQSADEAEVLFTHMAERDERRSLIITRNLAFSEWDRIFKNPMTTAAAIDCLVHHATILEIDRGSVRAEDAKKRKDPKSTTTTNPTTTTSPRDDDYPTEIHPA